MTATPRTALGLGWLWGLLVGLIGLGPLACDRNVGSLEIQVVVSEEALENPFASGRVARVRVRLQGPDLGVIVETFDYAQGVELSLPQVTIGDNRVVTLEGLSLGGAVIARGQSLPFSVGEGTTHLDLYVATTGQLSHAATPLTELGGTGRGGHHALLRGDGTVALVGGGATMVIGEEGPEVTSPVAEVDLFDPTSGRLFRGGSGCTGSPFEPLCLGHPRLHAAAGRSAGGDILIAGGEDEEGPTNQVEWLGRDRDTFSVGSILDERLDASFVSIAAGALLFGGRQRETTTASAVSLSGDGVELTTYGVEDEDGQPTSPPLLACERAGAATAVVGDLAFLFGGVGDDGQPRADYELLLISPVQRGSCIDLDPLDGITARSGAVATTVGDRFVVITGGVDAAGAVSGEVDLLDTVTNKFCPVGELLVPRTLHAAASLSGDQVLIVGGTPSRGLLTPLGSELLDLSQIHSAIDRLGIAATCESFAGLLLSEIVTLRQYRVAPTATTLGNDSVLVAGGFDEDGQGLDSFEVYVPAR